MKESEAMTKARRAVCKALEELEKETGMVVHSIALLNKETTQVQDGRPQYHRPQYLRSVEIQMYVVPGSNWGQGG